MKFDKEQMTFVVNLAMVAGLDPIESSLPPTVPLTEVEGRREEVEAYIRGCIGTVGTNLACLWAQTVGKEIGDGMGIGDALDISGFDELANKFVEERLDPNWPGLKEGDPCFPDTKPLAEKFVTEHWGDYFSPYSDMGLELDDGGVIEYPDTFGGDLRCIDDYGNTREVRHYPGLGEDEDQWWDWYCLFDECENSLRLFEGLYVHVDEDDGWDGEIQEIDHGVKQALVTAKPDHPGIWVDCEKLSPKRN